MIDTVAQLNYRQLSQLFQKLKVRRKVWSPKFLSSWKHVILHYCYDTYIRKCRQSNILPLIKRFEFNDLVLFYKVVNSLIPLRLPAYLEFFDGNSRLRSCHLDTLCLVSTIHPKANAFAATTKNSALNKSFFYRTHFLWNKLPFEARCANSLSIFRTKLLKILWDSIVMDEASDNES